ncbi:Eukaryotic translation initiation factor 3 subunit G [Frankliniella fusca]|uniref:Eukaryotic translation initiation factor 3 subunit G n=1 Tax=Frankliniella fusca TaxID=407009 RepID=A0AAE1HAJ8_9NEOP|nr:Eukaryotic translation initiation factor 3 subunit G [Frankliniella fusca]
MWVRAGHSTLLESAVKNQIEVLYKKYQVLRKGHARRGATFENKLHAFKETLKDEVCITFERVNVVDVDPDDPDPDYVAPTETHLLTLKDVALALDRSKASSRSAFRTVATVSQASASAPAAVPSSASYASLGRLRKSVRAEEAADIRATFTATTPSVLHFDGLKIHPLTGGETFIERLPIVVTGKLRYGAAAGRPNNPRRVGDAQAVEVVAQIEGWKCKELVRCVCTDTTTSNTGSNKGAVLCIEKRLQRRLVYLACRHHMFDLIPKAVFQTMIEPSSSPDHGTLCRNFRKTWPSLNHTNYKPAVCADSDNAHPLTPGLSPDVVSRSLKYAMDGNSPGKLNYLHMRNACSGFLLLTPYCSAPACSDLKPHIRADYEYLLRLAIIYLGGTPPGGSKFRPPLALSSARFMGRIIYSLTFEMFARTSEFAVDAGLLSRLREVNTFFCYRAWFTAPHSLSAARGDLHFVKVLLSYKDISPEVSKIAIASFRNHLWHLSSHCAAIAFFDPLVPDETKREMIKNLTKKM